MGKKTGIAWCDHTFNLWWGCIEVSPACDNCYAREWDKRFAGGKPNWGKDAPRRFFGDKHWNEPLKWDRDAAIAGTPALVFCGSMMDIFEGGRTDLEPHRQRLWDLIPRTEHLLWLLLSKRPQNAIKMLPQQLRGAPNIWLGTTIESPDYLWRADALNENRAAAVRFVSMEPLIEQTYIKRHLTRRYRGAVGSTGIDWVITGCESGENARPTPIDWYRALRDECALLEVPFFLKQAPRGADGITSGKGSWIKLKDNIIEQPYLDGTQHITFPERRSAA